VRAIYRIGFQKKFLEDEGRCYCDLSSLDGVWLKKECIKDNFEDVTELKVTDTSNSAVLRAESSDNEE
jgi:hypothetical protein